MGVALSKIPILPWTYLVDLWRWKVFSGEISPAEYQSKWTDLVEKYQGLKRPTAASPDDFDPGAKYHVAVSCKSFLKLIARSQMSPIFVILEQQYCSFNSTKRSVKQQITRDPSTNVRFTNQKLPGKDLRKCCPWVKAKSGKTRSKRSPMGILILWMPNP